MRVIQEQNLTRDSTDVDTRIQLAYAYAQPGRYDDGLRENERVRREMPASRDEYMGGSALLQQAWLLARGGRNDEAVTVLERVLAGNTGHDISKAILREDSGWANLRGNPRFERLIAD